MILPFSDNLPKIDKALYIAPNATLVGSIDLGHESTIWFNATLRADLAAITIGAGSNIQDSAIIHVNTEKQTMIKDRVTIGHGAIIHGCTINEGCLIGMGTIILDEADIGEYCLVAAGSLVPPRKHFPPRSLIMGSPARVIRPLTAEELTDMAENTLHYIQLGYTYRQQS